MNPDYGRLQNATGVAQAKRDPPIGRECDRLSKAIEVLHNSLGDLNMRLSSVSQPEPPTSPGGANIMGASPVTSEIQGRLAKAAGMVEDANARVREMMDRLDI